VLHREKFTTTTIGSSAPEAEVDHDHDQHCLTAPAMQPRWPMGQIARLKPGAGPALAAADGSPIVKIDLGAQMPAPPLDRRVDAGRKHMRMM
jgi:hypothetical protein